MESKLQNKIFKINEQSFNDVALEVFRFQSKNCAVFQQYLKLIGIRPENIKNWQEIPFLPIRFFKEKKVISTHEKEEIIFYSSNTGSKGESKHYVKSLYIYEQSFLDSFETFFGDISSQNILALLPAYKEREGSSLVYMVEKLREKSAKPHQDFFLYEHENLYATLKKLKAQNKPVILFGVSFALIDFAEKYCLDYPLLSIIETGGMKGRKQEITRNELHQVIQKSFPSSPIFSEYGMTELLSQAYLLKDKKFHSPAWMKVRMRELDDPLSLNTNKKSGAINIIDLANLYSCSFIATDDMGIVHSDGTFEITGRIQESDMRGCNLLYL